MDIKSEAREVCTASVNDVYPHKMNLLSAQNPMDSHLVHDPTTWHSPK